MRAHRRSSIDDAPPGPGCTQCSDAAGRATVNHVMKPVTIQETSIRPARAFNSVVTPALLRFFARMLSIFRGLASSRAIVTPAEYHTPVRRSPQFLNFRVRRNEHKKYMPSHCVSQICANVRISNSTSMAASRSADFCRTFIETRAQNETSCKPPGFVTRALASHGRDRS